MHPSYNNPEDKDTSLIEKVRQAIFDEMNFKEGMPLSNTEPLDTYGIDSLKAICIMSRLEDALGVEFENEEMESVRTVNDITKIAEEKLKNAA